MKKILTHYWLSGEPKLNLGETYISYILKYFGYQDAPLNLNESIKQPVLFSIGSEFCHEGAIQKIATSRKSVVWGYGWSWGAKCKNIDIRSVRGNITKLFYELDDSIPVGDPGFLLPEIFPFEPTRSQKALWIPHYSSRDGCMKDAKRWDADFFNVEITPSCLPEVLKKIVDASFVYTNSLHVCIACMAYNVPFAPCLPSKNPVDKPNKWLDVWSSLGNADGIKWFISPQDARRWWDQEGQYIVPPNMEEVKKSFPHDIAFDELNFSQ